MYTANKSNEEETSRDFFETCISDELVWTIILVNSVILSGIISIIGVIVNVINIIIFIKLGFSDTTNISFLSLSLADAGIVLMLLGLSVMYNPLFAEAVVVTEVVTSVSYVVIGWPSACFSRIAGCMTAFITVERFMCISIPLKVKSIITKSRTIAISLSAFVVLFFSAIPVFVTTSLGLKYDNQFNMTYVGLVTSDYSNLMQNITLTINVVIQIFVFITVVIFTAALIRSFLHKAQWRNLAANQIATSNVRDRKMVKMVILISVVFIALYFPSVVGTFLMMIIKEYNIGGRYRNLYLATFAPLFPLGAINSTANFFIFIDMSTKYRQMFIKLFTFKVWQHKPVRNRTKQIYIKHK